MAVLYIGANPIGRALTAFFATMVNSRLVAPAAAVMVLGLGLAGALIIDDDYLAQSDSAGYWARNQIDDYAFTSIEAKRAASKISGQQSVVMVGTAAMREGMLPPEEIQETLSKRFGHTVPVLNLSTGGQSPLEAAALVREIAPVARGTLVLAASPSRMAASGGELQGLLTHPRLAFWNDGIRDEARALGLSVPQQTGFYLWDNLQFYVVRLPSFVNNWLHHSQPHNDVQTYLGKGHEDSEEWDRDIGTLGRRLSGYDRNFANNIEPYRRLIRWIKSRGYPLDVVLLEIPLNAKAIGAATTPEFYPKHAANMEAFCRQEGCRFITINNRNLLPEDVFFDWSHLSSRRGKEIYTNAVMDEIVKDFK